MGAYARPHAGDVIIGENPAGTFVFSDVSAGTAPIACGTIEELLDRVARYADRRHAHVWRACGDETFTPVMNPALLRRMWSEFAEMPGLRLTRAQAQRLWGVGADTCLSALDTLVALGAIVCTSDGRYARPSPLQSVHFQHAS